MSKLARAHCRLAAVRVLVVMLALAGAPAAPVGAQSELSLDFVPVAHLADSGLVVELRGRVRCELAGLEVLESLVYIVQDGNTSSFGSVPVNCSGKPGMQVFTTRVAAFDVPFEPGEANVSAFVLLIDPVTQETIFLNVTGSVRLR